MGLEAPDEDVEAMNEALVRLEKLDPRQSQVVTMRYFAGLTVDETASALGVSIGTVERDWRFARSWLYRELKKGG